MEVSRRAAVQAAVVRQQVVELLQSHLEARHVVEPLRGRLVVLVRHGRWVEGVVWG